MSNQVPEARAKFSQAPIPIVKERPIEPSLGKPNVEIKTSNQRQTVNLAKLLAHSHVAKLVRLQEKAKKDKETKQKTIKFPTPSHATGRSKIAARVYSERNSAGKRERDNVVISREVKYDPKSIPDPSQIHRSKIKLPGIPEKEVVEAKAIAEEIKKEWKIARELQDKYKLLRAAYGEELKRSVRILEHRPENADRKFKARYVETEEKNGLRQELEKVKREIELNPFCTRYSKISYTTVEAFTRAYDKKLSELIASGVVSENKLNDKAFKVLVGYFSLEKKSENGFTAIPTDLINPASEDFTDSIQKVGRYITVNVLKINTAKKAEDYEGLHTKLHKKKLSLLGKSLSIPDLYKALFPGYLDGSNPPIREWRVFDTGKWKGSTEERPKIKNLAQRACQAAVIDYGGIVNPDTREVNIERLAEIDLKDIFYAEDSKLRGVIGSCEFAKTFTDALELAIPGILEVCPKHRFKYPGKWSERPLETMDSITEFTVEKKLRLVDEHGRVTADKLKTVDDWAKQFNLESSACLNKSGIGTAETALRRLYSKEAGKGYDLFGWGDDQINPGDLRFDGMWDGEAGRTLFKLKLAKSIHTVFEALRKNNVPGFINHTVKFDPTNELNPLEISRKDLFALNAFYIKNEITWTDHISAFGLTDPYSRNGRGQSGIFELLLGKVDLETGIYGSSNIREVDVMDRHPTKNILRANCLEEIPDTINLDRVNIPKVKEAQSDMRNLGIEGTRFEEYLKKRYRSKIPGAARIMYDAYACSMKPTGDKDSFVHANDRYTALEKIVAGRKRKDGPFSFPDNKITIYLIFIRDEVIDDLNIDSKLKERLKGLINNILDVKTQDLRREILVNALELNRPDIEFIDENEETEDIINAYLATLDPEVLEHGQREDLDKVVENKTLLSLLNRVIEHVNEVISAYELRFFKRNKRFSDNYHRVFGKTEIKISKEEEATESDDCLTEPDPDSQIEAKNLEADDLPDISTSKNWQESEIETIKIFTGQEKEDPRILDKFVEISRGRLGSRTNFLSDVEGGDLLVQIRLLGQFEDRLNQRASNRFDYSSFRTKTLPAHYIESIISIQDIIHTDTETNTATQPEAIVVSGTPGTVSSNTNLTETTSIGILNDPCLSAPVLSDTVNVNVLSEPLSPHINLPEATSIDTSIIDNPSMTPSINDTPIDIAEQLIDFSKPNRVNQEFIDTELFKHMPEWWPHKGRDPLAIPLLYSHGILYVGIPTQITKNTLTTIREKADCNIQPVNIRSDVYLNLSRLYKTHKETRVIHPDKKPIKQFIGEEEERILIENFTAMRIAVKRLIR